MVSQEELEKYQEDGVRKAEESVKEPGAMQQIDSGADRAQVQQMQIDLDGKPTGWAAAGYTAKMAERIDKGNEEIRERYYKNNPTGYRNYLDYAKRQQAATLATAADYEAANLRHARQEDEKLQAEHEANALAGFNGTFLATHKLNEADAISSAQDVLAAETHQNTALADEFADKKGLGSGDPELCSEVMSAHEAASSASVGKYRAAVKEAATRFDGKVDQLWAHNDKELHAIYNRTKERALAAGASPFTAEAIAQKTVNGVANKIMIDMFAGSEVGSGNRQAFEKWMANLKASQVVQTDENGTTYDPMRRWCLTRADVNALDEKYRQVVRYEQSVMKAQEKAQRLAEKEAQKRIDAENVNAIESVVFAAKNMRNRLLYGDMKNQDPHAVASKFIGQIANMLPGQYMKEKENAVTEINTVFDQVFNLREQVGKLEGREAMSAWHDEWNKLLALESMGIANTQSYRYGRYFFTDKDKKLTGESVETLNMDEGNGTSVAAQLICVGQKILSSGDIPDFMKNDIKGKVDALMNGKVEKDRRVTIDILNDIGFYRPLTSSREFLSFRAGEATTIEGASSGQSSTAIEWNRSGKYVNISSAKGDVIQIDIDGATYKLAQAEIDEITRRLYSQVADMREDISGTSETAVKRRKEISEGFRRYVRNSMIAKDQDKAARSMADAISRFQIERGGGFSSLSSTLAVQGANKKRWLDASRNSVELRNAMNGGGKSQGK